MIEKKKKNDRQRPTSSYSLMRPGNGIGLLWAMLLAVSSGKRLMGPFHDVLSEAALQLAVSEYSLIFRKAGSRNASWLELGELQVLLGESSPECLVYSSEVRDGVSEREACEAVMAPLLGRECPMRETCYRIVPVRGVREVRWQKRRKKEVRPEKDPVEANVVLAGHARDAAGLVVAARSAVDAASEPSRLKLHVIIDAGSAFDFLTKVLICALPPSTFLKVAPINETFLADRSPTFRKIFAVDEKDMNRTRKNLVKAPANYIRLYLTAIFPDLEKKLVIYLDSDVLVSADLLRLAAEATFLLRMPPDLHEGPWSPAVAAVKKAATHLEYARAWRRRHPMDVRNISVFNAGVMIIDLDKWQSHDLTRTTESWLDDYQSGGSQMPINLAVANTKWAEVDRTWNCFIRGNNIDTDRKYQASSQDACIDEPKIRHWTGRQKPWLPKGHLRFFWLAHAYRSKNCLDMLPSVSA